MSWSGVCDELTSTLIIKIFLFLIASSGVLYWARKKTRDLKVRWRIGSNKEIYEALHALKGITEAGRVQIYQFHNGEYFEAGNSMLKMSCTHEVVGGGVGSTCSDLQERLVSNFPALFNITENPHMVRLDIDELGSSWLEHIKTGGASVLFVHSLEKRGKIVGFVTFEYLNPDTSSQIEYLASQEGRCSSCPIYEYLITIKNNLE